MIGTIYKITSSVNKKVYIGLSYRYEGRWKDHRRCLKNGNHANKHLQAHYNKHGDVFSYSILWQKECSPEELFEKEQEYIKTYNSFDKTKGFNMNKGGVGSLGLVHPERELKKEQVLQIKRLLYFKAFQVNKMSRYLGVTTSVIQNIRDKGYYKDWTLSFDSYEQYIEYQELAKQFRCYASVKRIDRVYNWLKQNPNALFIPDEVEKNIHGVLAQNVRLREDYEHGFKIHFIEKRLRENAKNRENKAEVVLLKFLEGKTTREISQETKIPQRYVNGIISGDKLGSHCRSLRDKVDKIKQEEEDSHRELVENVCIAYINNHKLEKKLTQKELAAEIGIKPAKFNAIIRGENFKRYSKPYLDEINRIKKIRIKQCT